MSTSAVDGGGDPVRLRVQGISPPACANSDERKPMKTLVCRIAGCLVLLALIVGADALWSDERSDVMQILALGAPALIIRIFLEWLIRDKIGRPANPTHARDARLEVMKAQ